MPRDAADFGGRFFLASRPQEAGAEGPHRVSQWSNGAQRWVVGHGL
jgi:hypothetical protein